VRRAKIVVKKHVSSEGCLGHFLPDIPPRLMTKVDYIKAGLMKEFFVN